MLSSNRNNHDRFFSDFFGRDPFDDPFFKQPIDSFFSSSDDFFAPFGRSSRHRQRHEQQIPKAPLIEELSEDHDDRSGGRSGHQPIVEHPDGRNKGRKEYEDEDANYGVPKTFCQSYTFSSVTYGGPDGAYYTSSKARRTGANGLIEEQHEEKDSRTGQEMNRVLRGFKNKGHAVERKRDASGSENYLETLHNLTEEEKKEFDETWKRKADKYLPGWNKSNGRMIQDGYDKRKSRAITSGKEEASSSKETTWKWPWAKRA